MGLFQNESRTWIVCISTNVSVLCLRRHIPYIRLSCLVSGDRFDTSVCLVLSQATHSIHLSALYCLKRHIRYICLPCIVSGDTFNTSVCLVLSQETRSIHLYVLYCLRRHIRLSTKECLSMDANTCTCDMKEYLVDDEHIYTCMHIHTYTYMHAYIYIQTCMHTYVYIHTYILQSQSNQYLLWLASSYLLRCIMYICLSRIVSGDTFDTSVCLSCLKRDTFDPSGLSCLQVTMPIYVHLIRMTDPRSVSTWKETHIIPWGKVIADDFFF